MLTCAGGGVYTGVVRGGERNDLSAMDGLVKRCTVEDCANKLRHYISRCPSDEMSSQARLYLVLLEGLRNKSLHANLYAKAAQKIESLHPRCN